METYIMNRTMAARGLKSGRTNFKRMFILDGRNMGAFLSKFSQYNFGPAKFEGGFAFNSRTGELALVHKPDSDGVFDHQALTNRFFNDCEPNFLVVGGLIMIHDGTSGKAHFQMKVDPSASRASIKALKMRVKELLSEAGYTPRVLLDVKQPVSALFIRGQRIIE